MLLAANSIEKALAVLSVLVCSTAAQSGPYTLKGSDTTQIYAVTQDTGGNVNLASKKFTWPNLPYHADSGDGPRGTQQGYNICNSTTLGPKSMCQTLWVNSIDDFCIWGSPVPNSTVGEDEEQLVAYCTNAKHGSRVIPPGALSGVQVVKTPGYLEIIGYIDQTALSLKHDDTGGEEDPHGADNRGNPLGGLVYSSAFGNSIQQVVQWNYFVGSGIFCLKACDPTNPSAFGLCENRYDRVGCTFNMPADYAHINGTFESCAGDNQLPVGVYVTNGQTMTWSQPPEGVEPSVPYVPFTPSSSQCSTYSSPSLFSDIAAYQASISPSSSTSSNSAASTDGGIQSTATSSTTSGSNGAVGRGVVSTAAALFGVAFAFVAVL